MKEAYAWWMREYLNGLRVEINLPQDWTSVRTILLFASTQGRQHPKIGDQIYFEINDGIQQIESLKTETHLFLFDKLPRDPLQALFGTRASYARYTCTTLGAENRQGNIELVADWCIDEDPTPILKPVRNRALRPQTPAGKQQVRAEVKSSDVVPYEYLFERSIEAWNPVLASEKPLLQAFARGSERALAEATADKRIDHGWRLVTGLVPREGVGYEKDQAALQLAAPESGSFVLVSLRRKERT